MLLPLFLFISFPLLLKADDSNEPPIVPFEEIEEYKNIESFSNGIHFEPRQKCPCGEYKLNEMKLVYFQWDNTEMNEKQLARYLISTTYFNEGKFSRIYHATRISYPENDPYPHECVAIKMAKERKDAIFIEDVENINPMILINREINLVESFRGTKHIIGYGPRHYYYYNPNEYDKQQAIVMQIGNDFDVYWGQMEDNVDDNNKKYSEEMMLQILKQILIGIDEIHQKDFVHLDLKPGNIVKMPGNEIQLKLIDFGSAIKLENGQAFEKREKITITQEFAAPEIYMAKNEDQIKITEKVDIWSFGMIILDLLSNTPTYKDGKKENKPLLDYLNMPSKNRPKKYRFENGINQESLLAEIIANHLSQNTEAEVEEALKIFLAKLENVHAYPKVIKILKDCLIWEPEKRPSAKALIKEHFKDISTTSAETTKNADFFVKGNENQDNFFGEEIPKNVDFYEKWLNI